MRRSILVLTLVLTANAYAASPEGSFTDLNTVVVRASRSDQTYGNMTRPVSIITADDIASYPGKSLPEIIRYEAGVYGVQYGNIKNSLVDIRGNGEQAPTNVLVLLNGQRINQIDIGGPDWSMVDPSMVERIEIIRGSGAVIYGDNANGGVINIITKKSKPDTKPTVTVSEEWGSYQTQKQGFQLDGGTAKTDYHFDYSHEATTGFRANSDYWDHDFNTRLGFHPTEDFSVDFVQGYHLDSYELPGALFLSNIAQVGRAGVRASLNGDHGWTSDSHFDITPKLKFTAGNSDGEFSILTTERKRLQKFQTGVGSVFETVNEINSYEFQPKVVISTPLNSNLTNKATAGYDYFYAKNRRASGTVGTPEDLVYSSKVTHGVYLLDELELDEKWLMNAGARGSWADYVFDQKQVIPGKFEKGPTVQGFEGGLGYKYNPDSKVYFDYEHSYRLPAIDEFFQNFFNFGFGLNGGINPALTYQEGNHYEIGIKDHTIKDLELGANVFFVQYKNEIYLDPFAFLVGNYNARTRHYGVELEGALDLLDGKVKPFANFTVQEARFKGGSFAGNEIPGVPEQLANAGVTLRPFNQFSTTMSVNYTGEQFAISDQSNTSPKLKRYYPVDWSASYTYKNVELWLSLRNIFNEKYNAYGVLSIFSGNVGYYPAPGRNALGGVKVKF